MARWQAAREIWTTAIQAKATNAAILSSTDPVINARRETLLVPGDHDATIAAAYLDEMTILAELGELLLAPVLEQVDETMTTLIISPDGLLHRLPLTAITLPDEEGQAQPLIDRLEFQLVPSATSLAILRGLHGPRVTWPAALLAAAPFATDDPNDRTRSWNTVSAASHGLRNWLRSLWLQTPIRETRAPEPVAGSLDPSVPSVSVIRELLRAGENPRDMELPHSGPEIVAVASLLTEAGGTASLLSRQKATRSRLETELPAARILHLATHGGALEKNGTVLDYRIFLADETDVRIHELYDGTISLADVFLVNLSACSLGEVMLQGAEASGFVQAFLQAGAGVVLAPLWEVDDRATKELMVRFYEELTASDRPSIASAWRRACRRLRTETGYRHPIYWAGFQPSGDASLRLTASA